MHLKVNGLGFDWCNNAHSMKWLTSLWMFVLHIASLIDEDCTRAVVSLIIAKNFRWSRRWRYKLWRREKRGCTDDLMALPNRCRGDSVSNISLLLHISSHAPLSPRESRLTGCRENLNTWTEDNILSCLNNNQHHQHLIDSKLNRARQKDTEMLKVVSGIASSGARL